MIKLGKKWYLQSPFRKPWGKWAEIEIDLGEKLYDAVVNTMLSQDKAVVLNCSYCRTKLAYVSILKKYQNFPVICTNCLVGE